MRIGCLVEAELDAHVQTDDVVLHDDLYVINLLHPSKAEFTFMRYAGDEEKKNLAEYSSTHQVISKPPTYVRKQSPLRT